MSIRMIRATEELPFCLPEGYCAQPFSETALSSAAAVLFAAGAEFAAECEPGTLAGATCEVERYLTYHRQFPSYDAGIHASTLIIAVDNSPVAVCLIGIDAGGQPDIYQVATHPLHRRRGLATAMINRALTVLAADYPTLDLWVNSSSPNRRLYRGLGFTETGEVT